MNCRCGKFGYCSFSRFGINVKTDRQTERQTDTHTDADERRTPATFVGVSNYEDFNDSTENTIPGKVSKIELLVWKL